MGDNDQGMNAGTDGKEDVASVSLKTLMRYLLALYRHSSAKAGAAMVLLIVQGFTDGFGILMLIPLMHLAGVAAPQESAARVPDFMVRMLRNSGMIQDLIVVLGFYVGVVSASIAIQNARTVINASVVQGFVHFLRTRLYSSLAEADWLTITRTRSSDVVHVLTAEIPRVGSATHYFFSLISTAVILLVHVAVAFMLSPAMAGITLACTLVLMLCMRPANRHALRAGYSLHRTGKGMYAVVTEHLAGMKTAKSFGVESRLADRFRLLSKEASEALVRFARVSAATTSGYHVGGVIIISILFYVAVAVIKVPTAHLFLLVFVFSRILPLASGIHQQYQNIVNMLPAYAAVTAMQGRLDAAAETRALVPATFVRLEKAIVFRHVSFRYGQSREHPALRDIDLTIPARRVTAIAGASGSGKTTLADLVMGLLTPTEGEVLLDGLPLTGSRLHAWRHSVAYVPQEAFLFHDTIRANLSWVRSEATEDELWEALEAAAAAVFVRNLPRGLETVVGDRGGQLSGGERQRIALARALLKRPTLLILDEATSSLDPENERHIQRSIEQLNGELTVIVIAHRLSTIRGADRIIVLRRGEVAESGAWNELAAAPGGDFQAMLQADGLR